MDRYSPAFVAVHAWNLLPVAAFLLYTGLRGILFRKPFLIPMAWVRGLLVFVFGTQLILLYVDAGARMSTVISMSSIPLLGLLLAWFGGFMRGQQLYGATTDSLREGILSALESLGVDGVEHLGSFRVPAWDARIEASVQPNGVGRIGIDAMHRARLREVAAAMNRYYATTAVATRWTQCYLSAAFGSLLAVWLMVDVLHRGG